MRDLASALLQSQAIGPVSISSTSEEVRDKKSKHRCYANQSNNVSISSTSEEVRDLGVGSGTLGILVGAAGFH